jgi:hypothetical protein
MSHRKYLQERFSLAFSQTLGAFDKNIPKLFLGAVLLGLGVFFYWYVKGWPEASEEFTTLIIVSIAPAFLMFFLLLTLNFSFYSPYTLHAQLSEKLAKTSDITIQQVRGHEDNIQSTYSTADSWFVLIRNLAVVNHSDKDDVVSIKLCWLLNRKNVLDFSPQTTRPAIRI